MKISALIPYKADYGLRDHLWEIVRSRYQAYFPEIEICLGIDDREPFSRASAINKAARIATGDILIITDTDVIFNPDLIKKITLGIFVHPWLIPFSKGHRLKQQPSEQLVAAGIPEFIRVNPGDVERTETTAGAFMNVMTRECFETVSGFDESFRGWGCEDTAFVLALDTICGRHFRLDEEIYHLWHPHASTDYLDNNWKLLEPYINASGNREQMRQLITDRHR